MNTKTFAQAQDFTAITDEELMAVNGGVFGAIAKAVGKGILGTGKATRNYLAADAVIGMAGDAINGDG